MDGGGGKGQGDTGFVGGGEARCTMEKRRGRTKSASTMAREVCYPGDGGGTKGLLAAQGFKDRILRKKGESRRISPSRTCGEKSRGAPKAREDQQLSDGGKGQRQLPGLSGRNGRGNQGE